VATVGVDAQVPSRDTHGFACAHLPSTSAPRLKAGASYVLAVSSSCDAYYDDMGCTITTTGGEAASVKSVYGGGTSSPWHPGGGGIDHCYGPLNFYYAT
jgi:hypothetical protein